MNISTNNVAEEKTKKFKVKRSIESYSRAEPIVLSKNTLESYE